MRLLAGLVVLGTAAALVWWRGTERPATTAEPEAAAREIAGPGYVPESAPLQAPPAPRLGRAPAPIDFDDLSYYDYDPEADIIPEQVRELDGQQVELRGVMYYGVEDPDRVTSFFLMPNHMICCYGTPRLNEYVEVDLADGRSTQYVLNYYLVRGLLRVAAVRDDRGRVVCLYRILDAEAQVME